MKMIRYIGGFVLAGLLLAVVACDKIKDGDRLIDQGVLEIKSERCVLLEDYTGVGCVNCADLGAPEIAKLQAVYGKNLVVVGLYPKGNPGLTMPYEGDPDLRTEEAEAYATAFQIPDYPKGMVNRKEVIGYQSWGGAIQNVLDDTATDYVNLTASATLNDAIRVSINGDFKQDYLENGDINIIAMIVEDNIKATQLTGSGDDADYIHNHVLRTVISNDIWGDKILDAKPAEGTKFTKQYTANLKSDWKKEDLAVVVLVTNASSREVLQAAYVHAK